MTIHVRSRRAGLAARAGLALLAFGLAVLPVACAPEGDDLVDDTVEPVAEEAAEQAAETTVEDTAESDAADETEAADVTAGSDETDGAAGAADEDRSLVLYSGRSETLVGPLVERFSESSGIAVDVRWGDTAELAATLLEEGERSPADVFLAQDPGGLGAVVDLLSPLDAETLESVDARYRDPQGRWIGVSGRSRVVAYNTERVTEDTLPDDLRDLLDPEWSGRISWAPTNGSFQAMISAMRVEWGEEETRAWLEGMLANEPTAYEGNTQIVAAVGAGEVDLGLVNHYYLYRFLAEEGDDFPARNHFLPTIGPGSLLMVSGAGILKTAANRAEADDFVAFLLSEEAQRYLSEETFEYPLASGIAPSVDLPALDTLAAPEIPLDALADLLGTVELLRDVGALP